MTVSLTEFQRDLPKILRDIERHSLSVDVISRGRVLVRVVPGGSPQSPPWKRLHGLATLKAAPGDSVLSPDSFDACRD